MSLQFRIGWWLLFIGVLGIGISIFIDMSLQQSYLTDQFDGMAVTVGDAVRYSLEGAMVDNRPDEVLATINNVRQQPMVAEIAIYGPTGEVWEATDPEAAEAESEMAMARQAMGANRTMVSSSAVKGKSLVSVVMPIANTIQCQRCHIPAQKVNGAIRVYMNTSWLDQHIKDLNKAIAGMALIMCLVLVGVSTLVLRRIVVDPLSRMANVVRAFGDGDYGVKMREDERRGDELGMLARSFGEMGERIARQTSDLNERISELANELARANIFGKITDSNGEFGEPLAGLVDTTRRLLHADACSIHLAGDNGDEDNKLVSVAFTGNVDQDQIGNQIEGGLIAWAVRMRTSAIARDIANDPRSQLPVLETQDLASPSTPRYTSMIAMPLLAGPANANGKALGALCVFTVARRQFSGGDVSLLSAIANQAAVAIQNAQAYARVSAQSITDGLTGIYNHRYLYERLEEEVARAGASGQPLSVLFLDIDSFKTFNDLNGHALGDVALKIIAGLMKESCRSIDIAARYGGEEFVMVLPETNVAGAEAVAERVRERIGHYPFKGQTELTFPLSVSVGVASFPQDARSARDLIDKADWAMYYAKRKGRNQVRVFSALDAALIGQDEQTLSLP